MTWLLDALVALLAAGLGTVLGGFVMAFCVEWYEVSSFEGRAGYAIVFMALLGGIVGFAAGLVIALTVPEGASLPFLRALGLSAGLLLVLAAIATVVARSLADIPPTLDGRELELEVEIRIPADRAAPADHRADAAYVELGATRRRVQRTAVRGKVRLEDARCEEGRWILPATADVFTRRGERLLTVRLGDEPVYGFIVPLPPRPGRRHLAWSEWLPRPLPNETCLPETEPSYRFRVRLEEVEDSAEDAA